MEPVVSIPFAARLQDDPKYRGTSHDDAVARRMGFRAALVPGAFLYGRISRLAIDTWGGDWLDRGAAWVRFIRPVYNGDRLILDHSAVIEGAGQARIDVRIRPEEGEDVAAVGWIALPDVPAAPPPVPTLQPLSGPVPHAEKALSVGFQFATAPGIMERDEVAASLAEFAETHPVYNEGNCAHPGFLLRRTMGDTLRSMIFDQPVIFVSARVQNFARLHAGASVSTTTCIAAVYEKRGRRYFDSDELLIADGAVVARHERVNLYGSSG